MPQFLDHLSTGIWHYALAHLSLVSFSMLLESHFLVTFRSLPDQQWYILYWFQACSKNLQYINYK